MPVEKAKRLSNLVSLGGNERNWGVSGDNASMVAGQWPSWGPGHEAAAARRANSLSTEPGWNFWWPYSHRNCGGSLGCCIDMA